MREKDMNLLKLYFSAVLLLCTLLFFSGPLLAQAPVNRGEGSAGKDFSMEEVDQTVRQLMEEGDIPGLMLVLVKGDGKIITRGYGYANLEQKRRVTGDTLFELASVSKAFTALAALQCEEKGLFNLDDRVSKYLPWFYVSYKGMKTGITIRQLLHQTSGIPVKSVSLIPQSNADDALEQTVRNLVGIELDTPPGQAYQYATINYDVVAAVIQKAANRPFEDYMKENVLIPLGMGSTKVGVDKSDPNLSTGHKISFFEPREYDAPIFRGNNAAGYVVSNGKDISRWLQYQMGARETEMKALIEKSHTADTTVAPNPRDLSAYCMGWFTYFNDNDIVDHAGMNPNFSTYMAVSPKEKIGVAVLANSNSNFTRNIGYYAISVLQNLPADAEPVMGDNGDKGSSVFSFLMSLYILCTVLFILSIFYDLFKGRRQFEGLTVGRLGKLAGTLALLLPFFFAIYLVPMAIGGVSWQIAFVWRSGSFKAAIFLAVGAIAISYAAYVISTLLPQKNKYIRSIPLVVILSLLAGFANAMVIFLITNALFTKTELVYQLYYFVLAFLVYILGRKVLQTKLIRITFDIVYDMRIKLIDKIFHTSYQRFEKLDRGRILATMNDDTAQIGEAANIAVRVVTSGITVFAAFLYLATIAFWATMVTTGVVGIIAALYAVVTQRTRVFFEDVRDTRNVYMRLLDGLIDGFKELSMHSIKRKGYHDDVEKTCDEFRNKLSYALIKFVNAFLVGESLLVVVLGAVAFVIPRMFPHIDNMTLMGFIMVLLYLIGPINGILNAIPGLMQLKISWVRVKEFMQDIPANIAPGERQEMDLKEKTVEHFNARGLTFAYEDANGAKGFSIGPIDLEAKKGEVIFIIGGNGSGKTSVAKLFTGLYVPDGGTVEIDGKEIPGYQLGEYYSTVYGNYHLFEKLYNVDLNDKKEEVRKYLRLLRLNEKVTVEDNKFTTINLSGGQRKRLALLQCYLENCPIFLFDEVAADQDPEFRKFFYRDLLFRMKEKGKIVIAITHDDHYFDVADKVIKLEMGKVETVDADYQVTRPSV